MKATLLYRNKRRLDSDATIEEVVWLLPQPDSERPHGYKYRLAYISRGRRLVGYDNERGKGDHRHYGDHEEHYSFTTVDQLLADFRADVKKAEKR
ncbi:MAG: DUF6516 family protein [Candidatus Competibacteraceae bacterium]